MILRKDEVVKMLISCPTSILDAKLGGVDKAIELLAGAGFDAYDITLCGMYKNDDHWGNVDGWREEAHRLRAVADSSGILCNQCHAPFPSSVGDDEKDAVIFEKIVRSMEIASIMGAKIIVVHPKQHLTYAEHREELFRMNVEFYKSLIPYCERFGIKVATENMWQHNKNNKSIIDSTCSRACEFCDYIDAVGSEWLVGCLDIGHAALIGANIPDFIRAMGKERLQSLHVHDVDYIVDSHTLPYTLKIDYDEVAAALAEIGYEGDITFEAMKFFNDFPIEVLPDAARLMCAVGRHIARIASGA